MKKENIFGAESVHVLTKSSVSEFLPYKNSWSFSCWSP